MSSAWSQTAISASAQSDYRYRGVSLNGGQPELRLNVNYDQAQGWYAGGSLTQVRLYSGRRQAEWQYYLGIARRVDAGTWELGASRAHFTVEPRYDYGEFYVGWLSERWNVRTYLSPSYFGAGQHTVYFEWNGGLPLDARWHGFAHVGALAASSRRSNRDSRDINFDVRIGLGLSAGDAEWQLARVSSAEAGDYPVAVSARRQAGIWVLGVTWSF